MTDSIDILRAELFELVSSDRERLDDITRTRASQERTDNYTTLLREILSKSSLCYLNKVLSFFNGKCYVPIGNEEAEDLLSNMLLDDFGIGATDVRRIGNMPFLVVKKKQYAVQESKVCFANCVLDVATGEVMPFGADNYTEYSRPFAYHDDARSSLWKSFLNEVMPDEDEQMCLQEFFGMCFLDRSRLSVEKFAIFVGEGSNGKSVVCDVISKVIGEERVSHFFPEQLMEDKKIVDVAGKKLNIAYDLPKKSTFDSTLKALSSGQAVAGWKIYSGTIEVKCPPLVFALNEMPRFRDLTSAFFRRVMLFSFDVTIPESKQDRSLADRIVKTESSGVFRWIMEGLWRLQSNGGMFTYCKKMEENLDALKRRVREEESPVLQYLSSAGWSVSPVWVGQEYTKVTASAIFDGMSGRVSKDAITRELTSLGVKRDRGTEVRYFLYKK